MEIAISLMIHTVMEISLDGLSDTRLQKKYRLIFFFHHLVDDNYIQKKKKIILLKMKTYIHETCFFFVKIATWEIKKRLISLL